MRSFVARWLVFLPLVLLVLVAGSLTGLLQWVISRPYWLLLTATKPALRWSGRYAVQSLLQGRVSSLQDEI